MIYRLEPQMRWVWKRYQIRCVTFSKQKTLTVISIESFIELICFSHSSCQVQFEVQAGKNLSDRFVRSALRHHRFHTPAFTFPYGSRHVNTEKISYIPDVSPRLRQNLSGDNVFPIRQYNILCVRASVFSGSTAAGC